MAAADSPLTTLLENIAVNLQDTTNHPAIAALLNRRTKTSHKFTPWANASGTPYALITPGDKVAGGEEGRNDLQDVDIWIVHAIINNPTHYYSILGTSAKEGILTIHEEIEKALVRPEPYTKSPYNSSPYTNLIQVRGAWLLNVSDVELHEHPMITDNLFVRQKMTMQYIVEKGT